jgi:phage shock protein PspC (stress-responsive transcriptional regulator)
MKRCPYCAEEIQDAAIKCKHCGAMLDGSRSTGAGAPRKALTRSRTDKMFSGVCGGLAAYCGMDPVLMRLLVAILVLATGILPGLIAYIIAAIIIPEEVV